MHALGQHIHSRGGLLQAGGLLFGAAGKVVGGLRNFVSSTADADDRGPDGDDRLAQRSEGGVEAGGLRQSVTDRHRQVAPADLLQRPAQFLERLALFGFQPLPFAVEVFKIDRDRQIHVQKCCLDHRGNICGSDDAPPGRKRQNDQL